MIARLPKYRPDWMLSTVDRPTSTAGRHDFDGGQARRVLLERLHRDAQSRQDDPAQIVASGAHDVEGGRRAEIDDDEMSARVEMRRPDRVRDAIGTDLERIAIADLQARLDTRLQDERIDSEVLPAAASQRVDDLGDHRADRDLLDSRQGRVRSRGSRSARNSPNSSEEVEACDGFRKRTVNSPASKRPPKIWLLPTSRVRSTCGLRGARCR